MVVLLVFNFYRDETTKFQALNVAPYQSPMEAVPIGPKPPNC